MTLYEDAIFVDYIIADSNDALVRRRIYINILPYSMLVKIYTLGRINFIIPRKTEYYKYVLNTEGSYDAIMVSRREYIALRNEQRIIYSSRVLSKEFMQASYSIENIGLKRKKLKVIAATITAWLMPYFGIPMLILWIPEYKDAKILHKAYVSAMNKNTYFNTKKL